MIDLWPKGPADIMKTMVKGFAAAAGLVPEDRFIYDFKLDQWGLERRPGEGFDSYLQRVLVSPIW